jgi:hypothetical protein
MKKMGEKNKRYKYTREITNSPSNQAIRITNTNFPSPPRKSAKREASRGLVKILANCLLVSMYLISISPFSM